jgi:hypothetical protein
VTQTSLFAPWWTLFGAITDGHRIWKLQGCRFTPGAAPKRFVRDVKAQGQWAKPLTPAQLKYVDDLAHSYRKQLGRCLAVDCPKCSETRCHRVAAFLRRGRELTDAQQTELAQLTPAEVMRVAVLLGIGGVPTGLEGRL